MSQETPGTENNSGNSKKNGLVALAVIAIIAVALSFIFNSKTIKSLADFYVKITTPVSSYILNMPVEPLPVMTREDRTQITVPLAGAEQFYLLQAAEGLSKSRIRNNLIYKILTFGSSGVRATLDAAYFQGQYLLPYHIFVFEKNEALYESRLFNAASVLLYGYSWLINIPAKILNILDAQIDLGKNPYSGVNSFWLLIPDDIWAVICTICIDIPCAIINTIIGFFVALIFHPINSLIAIPGAIYYGVLTTFFAVWDILANIVMIPYHLFT